jgi:hypothetical protein
MRTGGRAGETGVVWTAPASASANVRARIRQVVMRKATSSFTPLPAALISST